MEIKRTCKIHGEHTRWRVRDRVKEGRGTCYRCKICKKVAERKRIRRKREEDDYNLIAEHIGVDAAEEYKSNPKARLIHYLYRGKNFYVPRQEIESLGVNSTKYKFMRLGEKRALGFLKEPTCEQCGLNHHSRRFYEIHHKIPKTFGGTNDETNLIILCPNCHKQAHLDLENGKGNPFSYIKITS